MYPTDTAYGIGVDATSNEAAERLLAYKGKREGKAVAVMVADKEMAGRYVEINETAEKVIDRYLPGAVTVVGRSKGRVAEGLTDDGGTLGIRIVGSEFCQYLCKSLGRPVTCTSANISYGPTPYSLNEYINSVEEEKRRGVVFIDGGRLKRGLISTVVGTTEGLRVLRQGAVEVSI